ncbi:MAG: hypothetical protein AB1420_03030 [Bacillota bacterium]
MAVEDRSKYSMKMGGSTFVIRIHFKQNANWQGTIQWLEENKTVSFRSILEMIFLLNEAIDKIPTSNGEFEFRSWDDLHIEPYYSDK